MTAGRITWSERVRRLKAELRALYLAARDARTPWYAKAVALVVVGYAFSPIDLIPDVIPIIGYLDDAILVPLGIMLTIRLVPDAVMDDCRRRVAEAPPSPRSRWAGVVVVAVWLALAALSFVALRRLRA